MSAIVGCGTTVAMSTGLARNLRRTSSDAEIRLWAYLRARRLAGYRFRRQHPIGPFIVDFACTEHHLVVEADGSQLSDDPDDVRRTEWLTRQGWRVVRFWNNDILANTEGVLESILSALRA
jgi:very-short-patch-repair endonuclease